MVTPSTDASPNASAMATVPMSTVAVSRNANEFALLEPVGSTPSATLVITEPSARALMGTSEHPKLDATKTFPSCVTLPLLPLWTPVSPHLAEQKLSAATATIELSAAVPSGTRVTHSLAAQRQSVPPALTAETTKLAKDKDASILAQSQRSVATEPNVPSATINQSVPAVEDLQEIHSPAAEFSTQVNCATQHHVAETQTAE